MPLIGTTEMFKKAYEGHYAIGFTYYVGGM